jgi:hypothetical protein
MRWSSGLGAPTERVELEVEADMAPRELGGQRISALEDRTSMTT